MENNEVGRRSFIVTGASALASTFLLGSPDAALSCGADGEEVSANEDLMQEHGVLGRVLLIYDELAERIEPHRAVAGDSLLAATKIVTSYVQGHHEKVEETLVFPTLIQHNLLKGLVAVLLEQHKAGREVASAINQRVHAGAMKTSQGRQELAHLAHSFSRMFRPHALREDTLVFPILRQCLGVKGYIAFSEKMEQYEEKMFKNEPDLAHIVAGIDKIEIALGINDLRQFTAVIPKHA